MLKLWLPSSVASYRLAHDLGAETLVVPPAGSWLTVPPASLDQLADQVPAVTVWGGATVSVEPVRPGWAAWSLLTVAAVDRHEDWESTALFAQAWSELLTATMLQHPTLGDTCDDLRWIGTDPTVTRDRTLAVVVTTWQVYEGAAGAPPLDALTVPPVGDVDGIGPETPLAAPHLVTGVDLTGVTRDPTSAVEAP